MYNTPKLNEKIAAGKMVLGSHIGFDSPFITEMLAGCGFDFIWIDAEHCAIDRKDIQMHLLACRAAGAAGIVRVPSADPSFIKGVLDMGADGIVIPLMPDLASCEKAVLGAMYPPEGIRGLGVRRACNYGLWSRDEYVATAREKIWTIIQVEQQTLVKDLDAVAQLPGVSGFVVGPNDFAMSMTKKDEKTGQMRACTPSDPEVREQYDLIGKTLSKYKKPFGVSGVHSEQFVKDWTARGVNFICQNFDFHYIVNGGKAVLADTKKILKDTGRDF